MTQHWFFKIGELGRKNFLNSQAKKTWGIDSKKVHSKSFLTNALPGDILWFISNNKVFAIVTFMSTTARELGPIINFTATNEELGWEGDNADCDTEIHYTDLYDVSACCIDLSLYVRGQTSIRIYKEDNPFNCVVEYDRIARYSKAVQV